MTGPEHYSKAEELLGEAAESPLGDERERYFLAAAQVHATLALAAATALLGPVAAGGYTDVGLRQWHDATGKSS